MVALILLVSLAKGGRWPGPTSNERDHGPNNAAQATLPVRRAQQRNNARPRHPCFDLPSKRGCGLSAAGADDAGEARQRPPPRPREFAVLDGPAGRRRRTALARNQEPLRRLADRRAPESLRSAWASRLPSQARRFAALTPAELRLAQQLRAACSRRCARCARSKDKPETGASAAVAVPCCHGVSRTATSRRPPVQRSTIAIRTAAWVNSHEQRRVSSGER